MHLSLIYKELGSTVFIIILLIHQFVALEFANVLPCLSTFYLFTSWVNYYYFYSYSTLAHLPSFWSFLLLFLFSNGTLPFLSSFLLFLFLILYQHTLLLLPHCLLSSLLAVHSVLAHPFCSSSSLLLLLFCIGTSLPLPNLPFPLSVDPQLSLVSRCASLLITTFK